MKKSIIYIIVFIDIMILLFQTSQVSISYNEANIFYGDVTFLQQLVSFSTSIFGQNDFSLRLPMILLHLGSVFFLYETSKKYIHTERNRIWLVLIFILLPGIVSSAILVNNAGLIIFGLFLYVYISQKYSEKVLFALSFIYLFVNAGFIYLFIGTSVYYLYKKRYAITVYYITLLLLSLFLYGFETYGIPKGHFLDTLGLYATIFTPIIFVFIFYALYRRYLTSQTDLIWFLSSTVLVLSLLLSFRQKIQIEYVAPYLMISLPIVAQTFISSYRIRLKQFRKRYKLIFVLSLLFLAINYLLVIFNKELYPFFDNPKKHFVYKNHIASELAKKLTLAGIECVHTNNVMALRLEFYGIESCDKYYLIEQKLTKDTNVTISYKGRVLYSATVTKINKK